MLKKLLIIVYIPFYVLAFLINLPLMIVMLLNDLMRGD